MKGPPKMSKNVPERAKESLKSFSIPSPIQERFDTEEKFKANGTKDLFDRLIKGIDGLRQKVDSEGNPLVTEQQKVKLQEALDLALQVHIDQKDRPSGEPYVNHVLNVARRVVVEYGVTNPDMITAAALHDSVEDQSAKLAMMNPGAEGDERQKSFAYIANHFGERVANIIHSLSNEEVADDLDTDTKNKIYREHVAEAIKDPEVALVKLADFSDNALTLEKVADPKRRLKLTVKYMPVVEMFIKRLQDQDIQMDENKKLGLIEKLKSAHIGMEEFVKTQEQQPSNQKEVLIAGKSVKCDVVPDMLAAYGERLKEAPQYRKKGEVHARQATEEETVSTSQDGTKNIAEPGDWIIQNPGDAAPYVFGDKFKTGANGEKISIPVDERQKAFQKKYESKEGVMDTFMSKGIIRAMPVERNIVFPTSWGEEMAVEAGGYVTDGGYSIAKDSFDRTYESVS